MKILVVEDRKDKRQNIKKVILETGYAENESIETARTYFSAKNKIISKKKGYDLIILDMFLPDAKDDNELHGLAGKDLIFDMMNQGIKIPILVMTQYTEYTNDSINNGKKEISRKIKMENTRFGIASDDSKSNIYDCTYYEGLHEYLAAEVPMYLGIIFYSNQFKEWKDDLKYFIEKIQRS